MNDDNLKPNNADENENTLAVDSKVICDLRDKNLDLELRLNETYDLFLRSKADFDNLKKRTAKEIEHSVKYANKKFIISLLPLIDSLESCLNMKDENVAEDIAIFYKMLINILSSFGLKRISVETYCEFDPLKHEAVSFVESNEHDNLICEVVQNGYTLHDQVIRYSKVTIFRKDNI